MFKNLGEKFMKHMESKAACDCGPVEEHKAQTQQEAQETCCDPACCEPDCCEPPASKEDQDQASCCEDCC